MTREELAEIKARCERATPEWSARCPNTLDNHARPRKMWSDPYGWIGEFDRVEDAEFAAEARQDVPHLLAEVERLNALLKVAEEALEWISDPRKRDHKEPDHYTQLGCLMHKANEALAAMREGAK